MLESIFTACSTLAMLGWAALIFRPRHRQAHLLAAVVIPFAIGVVYLVLIARHFGRSAGGFGSLSDVALLFSNPAMLLAGWVHYLAFDLFIGAWETRDAQRHGIPHLLLVPCLMLTFLFGPIGLLSYWGLRTWRTRSLQLTVEP
ncbi:MAG: ABA4-like family protein [Acidobacteriota bacterium]